MNAHSYVSFSFRGSFPTYRCRFCGVNSTSEKSHQPCPGASPQTPPHTEGE